MHNDKTVVTATAAARGDSKSRMSLGLGLGLATALVLSAGLARAEIDGHGPDAWRVTGVEKNDRLNARMGPSADFPVIDSFAPDERGMIQVTCVPYIPMAISMEMSEAQHKALPPRWCLMRNKELTKAGWVAQRYISEDSSAAE